MKYTIRINEDGTRTIGVHGYLNGRRFASKADDVDITLPLADQKGLLEIAVAEARDRVHAKQGRAGKARSES